MVSIYMPGPSNGNVQPNQLNDTAQRLITTTFAICIRHSDGAVPWSCRVRCPPISLDYISLPSIVRGDDPLYRHSAVASGFTRLHQSTRRSTVHARFVGAHGALIRAVSHRGNLGRGSLRTTVFPFASPGPTHPPHPHSYYDPIDSPRPMHESMARRAAHQSRSARVE